MADNQWGEIFNLTEELKRIEDAVDKRLEETLAEDPHVIEQETVHYGVAAAAEDRAEQFRMKQTLPVFGPLGGTAAACAGDAMQAPGAGGVDPMSDGHGPSAAGSVASSTGARAEMAQNAPDDVATAAAAWNEAGPVGDYVPPRAAQGAEPVPGYDMMRAARESETAYAGEPAIESAGTQYAAPDGFQTRSMLPVWNVGTGDAVQGSYAAQGSYAMQDPYAAQGIDGEPGAGQRSDAACGADPESVDPNGAVIMGSAVSGPTSAFVMGKVAPDATDAERAAMTASAQAMAEDLLAQERAVGRGARRSISEAEDASRGDALGQQDEVSGTETSTDAAVSAVMAMAAGAATVLPFGRKLKKRIVHVEDAPEVVTGRSSEEPAEATPALEPATEESSTEAMSAREESSAEMTTVSEALSAEMTSAPEELSAEAAAGQAGDAEPAQAGDDTPVETTPGQQDAQQFDRAAESEAREDTSEAQGSKPSDASGRKPSDHKRSDRMSQQQILEAAGAHRQQILAALVAVIVVLAALLGYHYYQSQVIPGRQYTAAQALYADGQYDEAIAAFTEIRNYKDAASRITEIEYTKAKEFADAGDYQGAVDYIDNLSAPTDAMLQLRSSAIYQIAVQYYEDGDLGAAEGELLMIKDYASGDDVAIDLLHEIQYQEASEALAVYDYDTAEPILASLGDYEDAAILLAQVENAIDIVYTDVARDDNGKEIEGETEYLWVHSVITPGAVASDTAEEMQTSDADSASQTEAFRELAGATDNVDDEAVHVLMMHMGTTDAEMTYEDAEPVKVDNATIVTKDISSYAAIDSTFGQEQTVYSPQALQRSNTDYALSFDGSETYASRDRKDDEVVMECKLADDGYWCKTRRVYAELEDDRFIAVSRHQLRTWTKVLNESLADEVRAAFLANTN